MSVLWVDPVGGLAGDMLVAALVDAGVPYAAIGEALAGLGLPGWQARLERVWRGPFSATRFVVELDGPVAGQDHDHAHGHLDGHDHTHDHGDSGAPLGRTRRWSELRARLEASALAPGVLLRVLAVFEVLARAEGRVHGVPPESVSFHEVGAVDSIVDIVAVCVALEWLGVEALVVGPIPLGQGHVLGEHGWIPLPAPATLELLRGFDVEGRAWRGETVTPTGAAVVAAFGRSGPMPPMRPEHIGVGAGTWDPASHPNVVRVVVGHGEAGAPTQVVELRAELDALHPELVPALLDACFAAGALEANVAPIVMKKGRPGWRVTALAAPGARAAVGEALLRNGATLGYRWTAAEREVLGRRFVEVSTPFGPIPMKLGERDGVVLHAAPEYACCADAATAAGVPVVEVVAAAWAAWGRSGG